MGLEDLRGFQKFDLLFLKILIEIRGLLKMEIFFQKMRLCVGQFFFRAFQNRKGRLNKNFRANDG